MICRRRIGSEQQNKIRIILKTKAIFKNSFSTFVFYFCFVIILLFCANKQLQSPVVR